MRTVGTLAACAALSMAARSQCPLQLSPVAQLSGGVNGVASAAGVTYVTGYASQLSSPSWGGFARANGSSWAEVDGGLKGAPSWSTFPPIPFGAAVEALDDGTATVAVGGQFVYAGTVTANGLALYDGAAWSSMGAGVNGVVRALASDRQGGVFAGGAFTTVDGVAASRVAHWDGSQWTALGSGVDTPGGVVFAMTVTAAGDLVIVGSFQSVGGVVAPGIARWDGAAWHALPGVALAPSFGYAVTGAPNGDLFVGGAVQVGPTPASVARWDGATWSALLPPTFLSPRALEVLPDGSLVVQTSSGLSRWRDGQFSVVTTVSGQVTAIDANDRGQLHLGGSFANVGGVFTSNVARLQTACPASVAPFGPGCAWSAGAASLQVDAPAWLGGTYRARADGLPSHAVAASVYGLTPQVAPLWNLLPMTMPGCLSYPSADFVALAVAAGGALVTEQSLPYAPSLFGASLYHQLVVFELDAAGACVSVSASNALELTLGVF